MHPDSIDHANLAWFREAAPYLATLRGATYVIAWSPGAELDTERSLLADCSRLALLGARIVLVHGIRAPLDAALGDAGIESAFHEAVRITPSSQMPIVRAVAGSERLRIEATLSAGALSVGFDSRRLAVASVNAVTARPFGIHGGVDHECTGVVRRIDAAALKAQLDSGALVLQSPIGWAPSGELYNLRHEELATEIATALRADKLIFLSPRDVTTPLIESGLRELTPAAADDWIAQQARSASTLPLQCAASASRRGVTRTYVLDGESDGPLLRELLTRDGAGTMVSADNYEGLRRAHPDDIPGLYQLTAPLVEDGSLVERAIDRFETDIEHFAVVERDGLLVACAALLPHTGGVGEFCCLATHPDYRNGGRAAQLLAFLEQRARELELDTLFVLTTQTTDWFSERGFVAGQPGDLPNSGQVRYSPSRNSKVLLKPLG